MATLITDSNPIQLGSQNDESNLIRNRAADLRLSHQVARD